jgi:hypothetical protein
MEGGQTQNETGHDGRLGAPDLCRRRPAPLQQQSLERVGEIPIQAGASRALDNRPNPAIGGGRQIGGTGARRKRGKRGRRAITPSRGKGQSTWHRVGVGSDLYPAHTHALPNVGCSHCGRC